MILKTLSRKSDSGGQLIRYLLRYVLKEQTSSKCHKKNEKKNLSDDAFIIRHNIRSKNLGGIIQEFKANEKFRLGNRKNSVFLFHNIISFSNKDKEKINNTMLHDIAQKFVKERGENCIFVGTKHEIGIDHIHLHIVQSSTEINGRSARISKRRFQEIKKSLEIYQRLKYPELIHSLPNLEPESSLTKEAFLGRIKAARQTNKEFLIETIESIYASAHSKEDFLGQLEAAGCMPYYRGNKLQGLKYEGLKYRMSKLNITEELVAGLDKVHNLNSSLQELHRLRGGKIKERLLVPKEENQQTKPESKILEEIARIRSRSTNMQDFSNANSERERENPSTYLDILNFEKMKNIASFEMGE